MLVWFSNGYFAIPEKRILNIDKRWTRSIESTSFMVRSSTNFFFLLFQHLKNFWAQIYCRSVEFAVETKEKMWRTFFIFHFWLILIFFREFPFHRAFSERRKANSKISRKITINCSSLFSTCANSRSSLLFLFCPDNKPKKPRNWSGGNPGGFRNDVNWIMEVLSYRRSDFHVCDVFWLFF